MDDSNVIIKKLYPFVSEAISKHNTSFIKNINNFFTTRHEEVFAIAPYDRILYNQTDIDNLFKSLSMKEIDVKIFLEDTFFWNLNLHPSCIKEPYVELLLCAIIHYLKNNKRKEALFVASYLGFSGKFYASNHYKFFPTTPPSKYKSVMDYVVNNMLTDKYDLKKTGSIYGTIQSICNTWINTYEKNLKDNSLSDDEIRLLIQQLYDRIKSFLKNIAKLYYEAWENRNYLNYETDYEDEETFRLTNNDAVIAAKLTEKAVNYLVSNYVSLEICDKCKDSNVKALEIKDIMESILFDKDNLVNIKKVVNIIICDFMYNYPGKSVSSVDFVASTIKPKPNTKNKQEIELKEIITGWLDEKSPNYRKRKSRLATANSYYKSVLMYFALVINKISK